MLIIAILSTFLLGVMHSVLGEKLLIKPLLALNNLPAIRGSQKATRRVIRLAWHLTSLFMWSFVALLVALQFNPNRLDAALLGTTAILFGISAVVSFGGSRGRHPAWPLFLTVTVTTALSYFL
ncbi:MAG: hypothetical protein V3V30_09025 [Parvularculaceae bacterium]